MHRILSQVSYLRQVEDAGWRSSCHERESATGNEGMECRGVCSPSGTNEWIDNEVVGCDFEDERHGKRLRQLLKQLSSRVGATTPWACQDWANSKAAYRFFGNERISESNILAGHFACTRERFSASRGFPLLVLHDTTELSYRREDTASIGILKKIPAGHKGRQGFTPVAAF